jgi:RNA polymerase sigma-70 factor (ECF subfamily)
MGLAGASDAELVRRIACVGTDARDADARDTDASAAEALLCQRYAVRVRLYGLKHLRERERAEDLMQLVLLRLLQAARAGTIQDLDKVDRFVLGTCRLCARRMQSRAQRELPSAEETSLELSVAPFELLDTGAILRCLEALEPRARRVVVASFHEERSAEEIACELGLSPGNVRVLRHRALAALRQCMEHAPGQGAERRAAPRSSEEPP